MKYPRSPKDQVGGIVYLGRMLDKIRLMAAGELHPELHANLGKGFDERIMTFLGVDYNAICDRTLQGGTDDEVLEWCCQNGKRPNEEQIEIWNAFMTKRGWNDELSETLIRRKKESSFENRDDIQTMFAYIDADEGRA
jgi:hypothetical protein